MKIYKLREKPKNAAREPLKKYSELLQDLLLFRGIASEAEAEKFLNPDYDLHTHDPFLLKDMERAVERILKAIEKNERVIIFGDYDADGVPGGVVFHDFFKKIGFSNFENYIPDRNLEGFGLNMEALEVFKKQGVTLLITIDCGIGNVREVKRAEELGIDVIITDHHLPPGEVPKAYAIINPKQNGCEYPEKMLCGSGVIFKLVQALIQKIRTKDYGLQTKDFPLGWEKWLLDMVGIATLSDMVPLTGENRVFSYYGLKVLRKSPRIGLVRLLRELKASQKDLTEDDIGFTISPRINAASRMGIPHDAFKLLSTTDEVEAERLVLHLNTINDERKGLVGSMVKEIKEKLREKLEGEGVKSVIFMGNPSWRPSLLGLAANTLAEEHGCPVFLWGRDGNNILKGSCRGGGSVSLVSIMEGVPAGMFSEYGGHAGSGGFSVESEKIHFLGAELEKAYEKIKGERVEEEYFLDKKMDLQDVGFHTWREIEKLAPFGMANPKPVFLFENITLFKVEEFGKEKNHLKLVFKKNQFDSVNALKFFAKRADFTRKLEAGEKINLVATMEKSMFRSFPELRLRIVDIY